jgi:general secretion pathway protein K
VTEPFLLAFLEKVIDELPIPPGERALYDVRELTANLIDFIDGDDVRVKGGSEDDYYQGQEPPYRALNRPLLSLDELRLVEGFDATLTQALRAYLSVYPFAPGGCGDALVGCGVNLNTAPPHVLATLFYDDGVDQRLASEDVVREILQIREEGGTLCPEGQSIEGCTPMSEVVTNAIFPPPTFSSQIFVVTAEARVGGIRRSVEAVVDRSEPADPRLLSWRVR